MKLIRLTTEDPTAYFDASFNDGITIKPNSKIALQSVSAELEAGAITLTPANNSIIYQIKDEAGVAGSGNGGIRTVDLNAVTYNKTNTNDLLADITNKLNNDTIYVPGYNKVIGMEWKAETTAGKASIGYKNGGQSNAVLENMTATKVTFTGNDTWGQDGTTVTAPAATDYTVTAISREYISKGNGFFRAKIGEIKVGPSEIESGFIIGLTRSPVDPSLFDTDKMDYGIRVTNDGNGLKYWTQKLDAGGHPLMGPVGLVPNTVGFPPSDIIEIGINGGNVELNIYQKDVPLPINLATFSYDNTPLYGFMTFKNTRANATVNQVRLTVSPYDPVGLSLPPRPYDSVTPNFLRFESDSLSNFLGYSHARQPQDGYILASSHSYIADNVFTAGGGVSGFIIQLLNLSVDSYDSFKEQRENILAVIPSQDGNGDLNYTPSFPNFIDMLNKETITMRNIRVRIVNSDYSALTMDGLGLITLLID